MANRVLTAIGYQGQTVQLAPIVKPTKLHALRLDAPKLFAVFCSKKAAKKLYINDFEGKPIQSNSSATSNKDYVFGSFFDIGRLYEVTAGYGLDFSQNLHVLPGLKVTRIYGTRNQLATLLAAPSAASPSIPSAAQLTTQSTSS
ncbi:hypothetical protein [Parasitella parasitica]|uniref:Uncharacterized protein n=1 Tax=Parasitella parasitica TaxID=35722 RepID=A0A0B7MVS2_9FUNG|nr:hypothetical protein [Parasitella parasitica]